jgi:hypothetical protein
MTIAKKSAATCSPPIAPDQAITLLDEMDINWNYECTSASAALRRLELMRRFQKASEGFGYADISTVFACGLVSAVLQVTNTKEHALRELDDICARMRDMIETDYEELTGG